MAVAPPTGVIIGMAAAMVLNVFAMVAMGMLAGVTPSFALHGSAWAVGVTLGIVMPTMANVVPIRRALSSVLRDALDMYHQVRRVHALCLARGLEPDATRWLHCC